MKKKTKASKSDEDEEVVEDEKGDSSEDSDDEYDVSHYDYLVGNLHYDPDDDAVYKCYSISVVEGDVVVYPCKYDSKSQK